MLTATKFVLLTKYYQGNQIGEDETAGLRSMHGKDEKCIKNFSRKTCRRDQLEDVGVDWRIKST
jgi:hypothetical protein